MHQSIKEHIVQQAQLELLQTSFQDCLASSLLHASDKLGMQADFKPFPIIRFTQGKGGN